MSIMAPIDLSKPKYDQETYWGRALHFFRLTNPLNLLASDAKLQEAKRVVDDYKSSGRLPAGYDAEALWDAKYLHDSAFHPDTGEKVLIIGRMSAQMPMNTVITGGMLTFYKTTPAIVFWQWLNQTFNAVVNYSNRSGTTPISQTQLLASYCAACGGALTTALFLTAKAKRMNPVFARLVPFAAVGSANFINIPMMRSAELTNGTTVAAASGAPLGDSKNAARAGIFTVCVSRVLMAVPGMTITPVIMNSLTQKGVFRRRPALELPLNLALVACCVGLATPLCCAIFQQTASIDRGSLEPELQEIAKKKFGDEQTFYYNKGL